MPLLQKFILAPYKLTGRINLLSETSLLQSRISCTVYRPPSVPLAGSIIFFCHFHAYIPYLEFQLSVSYHEHCGWCGHCTDQPETFPLVKTDGMHVCPSLLNYWVFSYIHGINSHTLPAFNVPMNHSHSVPSFLRKPVLRTALLHVLLIPVEGTAIPLMHEFWSAQKN